MKTRRLLLLAIIVFSSFIVKSQWINVGQNLNGEYKLDKFGYAVDMNKDGSVIAVGAHLNDDNGVASGQVCIYKNVDDRWEKIGEAINGKYEYEEFGLSVSINDDGTIVAAGAPQNTGNGQGAGCIRIYKYKNDEWTQIGEDITGKANDWFGSSISINGDGTIVAVGAHWNSDNGQQSGHVLVFENINNDWEQKGDTLKGETSGDIFGTSVSISNDGMTLAIGAPGHTSAGAAYIYRFSNNTWNLLGNKITGENTGDQSAGSISLSSDGSRVAIGAERNSDNGSYAGQIRVFEYINEVWTQRGEDIDGFPDDWMGFSVSMSADGKTVAAGAPWNSEHKEFSGKVAVYREDKNKWIPKGNKIFGDDKNDIAGYSVCINADGTVIIVGAPGDDELKNGKVVIYNFQCSTDSTVDTTACKSYTVPSGDETYFTSGIYFDTITNASGCNSIITINLTVDTVNVSVNNQDPVLIAEAEAVVYQWLDCNDGFSIIQGATEKTFTATKNGIYAVAITHNECSDTSDCYSVVKASVKYNKYKQQILIYPSPTNGVFTIESKDVKISRVYVFDAQGKELLDKTVRNNISTMDISSFVNGVYFVKIKSNRTTVIKKVVKN